MPTAAPHTDPLQEALEGLIAGRPADPLAPVTVICPSRLAGIWVRRRLAERVPVAAVRCETLPRLAELLAADSLAAEGRTPLTPALARVLIGRVAARTEGPLAAIATTAGFPRALARNFDRLRLGGVPGAATAPDDGETHGHLAEVLRLYGLFRDLCAPYYDREDLLERAAAAVTARPRECAELGRLIELPPGGRSAAARRLTEALAAARGGVERVAWAEPRPAEHLILAPDPDTQAREVARHLVETLAAGVPLHEIAVLHGTGADRAGVLARALEAAGLPLATIPGSPLARTPAGAALQGLLAVLEGDLDGERLVNLLGQMPLAARPPTAAGDAELDGPEAARWARLCGVHRGHAAWSDALAALREELAGDAGDDDAGVHHDAVYAVDRLAAALDELERQRSQLRAATDARAAAAVIRGLLEGWVDREADGWESVAEVVDDVGNLPDDHPVDGPTVSALLQAELETATLRRGRTGEGVLLTPHTGVAAIRVRHAVVCDAIDGQFPAPPGEDPLVDDTGWEALAQRYPHLPTATVRMAEARRMAVEALCCGVSTTIALPLHDAGGAGQYPARAAVAAAAHHDAAVDSAEALRRHPSAPWCTRPPSPLASQLGGRVPLDGAELALRRAATDRLAGRATTDPRVVRARATRESRRRTGPGDLGPDAAPPEAPTARALERYAGCGLRSLFEDVLGLRPPEEPPVDGDADRRTLAGLTRTILADITGRRPPEGGWDRAALAAVAAPHLERARRRNRTGPPPVHHATERRLLATIDAALSRLDAPHRAAHGAAPWDPPPRLRLRTPLGQRLALMPSRIDRDGEGGLWLIETTTGRPTTDDDPLRGGRRLRTALTVAALRAETPRVSARIWRIRDDEISDRADRAADAPQTERALRLADLALSGMRAGSFPAVQSPDCRYCPWQSACPARERLGEERAAATPWGALRETGGGHR